MKLSKLLSLHLAEKDSVALNLNFGDPYLIRHNSIFRNIRNEALRLGFVFSSEPNDDYQALPLSQLPTILDSKTLPYLNNIGVLKNLELIAPDRADWRDISDGYRKNFVFHESCHAVAHGLSQLQDEQKFLHMLIEESFANTCELLAVIDVNDGLHRIFYEWNSYTALFEERTNLKNAAAEIGFENLFRFLFFGYLHSNFLNGSMEENHFNRVLKIASIEVLSTKQLKMIKALLKICFTLDARFREVTTGFYIKMNGLTANLARLPAENYLNYFEKNSRYIDFLNQLILIVAPK